VLKAVGSVEAIGTAGGYGGLLHLVGSVEGYGV
jgi:hypothetical protein